MPFNRIQPALRIAIFNAMLLCLACGLSIAAGAQTRPGSKIAIGRPAGDGAYIDTSQHPDSYMYAVPDVSELIRNSIATSLASGLHPARMLPAKLQGIWAPLVQYEGRFYVYQPCDGMADRRFLLHDSLVIPFEGADREALKVTGITDGPSYRLRLQPRDHQLNIYPVDSANGLAVFEMLYDGDKRRQLMVDFAHIRYYAVIINHCRREKREELVFAEPDFSGLIEKRVNVIPFR